MTPADPRTSTTAPAVKVRQAGPRRAARAVVDHTLTERQRAAVERLEQLADDIVGRLDLIDRDPDLEDDGTAEPVLGAPEPQGGHVQRGYGRMDQRHWNDGAGDDREQDDEREPSLGSVGAGRYMVPNPASVSCDQRIADSDTLSFTRAALEAAYRPESSRWILKPLAAADSKTSRSLFAETIRESSSS